MKLERETKKRLKGGKWGEQREQEAVLSMKARKQLSESRSLSLRAESIRQETQTLAALRVITDH